MSNQQDVTDNNGVKIEPSDAPRTSKLSYTRKTKNKSLSRVTKSSTNEKLSHAFRLLKFKRTLNKTLKSIETFKKSKKARYPELNSEDLGSDSKLPWETYLRKRKHTSKSKSLKIDYQISSLNLSNSRNEKIQKYERLRRKKIYRNVSMLDLVRKKHNLNPQNELKIKSGGDLKSYLLDLSVKDNEACCTVSPGMANTKEFLVVNDLNKGAGLYDTYKDIINRVLKIRTSIH